MTNRFVMKLFTTLMPIFTWLISFLIPGRKSAVAVIEARNKGKIMTLVQNLESYMDPDGKTPLQTIVEKCYAKGSFPALWAVEGAGKDLAEWHLQRNRDPKRILVDAELDPKRDGAWLMLHAGLGLGFAHHLLGEINSRASDEKVRETITHIVDLCRNNSRPGYWGAAIESLGLASRFMMNAAFCRRVHAILTDYAPDAVGFFWRGVGRMLYFHPVNFMPGFLRPCRAIRMAGREAPTPELKETLMAGIAWPMAIVNMTDPEVMEWILENHDDYFSGSKGFFNGVVASIVMRYDTTSDDPLIPAFMNHKPDPGNRTLCGLWNSKIKGSLETAIYSIYPILKKHQRLDEVFHYQSLPALAARLERKGAGAPA